MSVYREWLLLRFGNESNIISELLRDSRQFSQEEMEAVWEFLPIARKWPINRFMFYYLLCDPDKPHKCKVGVTKDPKQRIRAYRTAAPGCFFHTVYENVEKRHERRILEELRGMTRVDSEYVHSSPEMVQRVVEGYFIDNDIHF